MFKLRKWIIRSKKTYMFSGHISHGIRCRKNRSRNLAVWVLSPEAEVRRKITAEMLARLEPKLRVKKISEHQTWPEIGNSWISGKKVGCSLVVFWGGGSFQLLLFGKGDKFEDKCLLSLFRCIYIYHFSLAGSKTPAGGWISVTTSKMQCCIKTWNSLNSQFRHRNFQSSKEIFHWST